MEPIYKAALNIVSRTQPNWDGGLAGYLLDKLTFNSTGNATISFEGSFSDHVLSTVSRAGYAVSITFGLLWIIILTVSAIYLCCQRRRKVRRNPGLVFLSSVNNGIAEASMPMLVTDSIPKINENIFFKRREQLQSHWPCLVGQFFFFSLLTILLGTGVLLAFTASSQLHSNLASPPTHEEAIGRLLTPVELQHIMPSRTHVFPSWLRALAHIRAYLIEFVQVTKNHTAPVVDELIEETEKMQDRMTNEFNKLLFDEIGVSEALAQVDFLKPNIITLVTRASSISGQSERANKLFVNFRIELQSWLRLINSYSPDLDHKSCDAKCQLLHRTFVANLTARPDSLIPHFNFAHSLVFVAAGRNQTPASIEDQLNHGKIFAEKQLTETKRIMAERINIPKSIGDMIDQKWDMISTQLHEPIQIIDRIASALTRTVSPKFSSGSSIALAVGCIFWSLLLVLTIGVAWLVIHYHCVPTKLSRHDRQRVRSVAGCGLLLLAVSLSFAVILFSFAGYAFTEICRYLDPNQKMVIVSFHDVASGTYTKESVFPLDSHINEFLSRNWPDIKTYAEQFTQLGDKPIPLPQVRSPIHALTHKCRENMGILDALDGIRDFDMTILNDPKLSARFVNIGGEVMRDSLEAIDPNEMFPPEMENQLTLAKELDSFIVDFNEHRKQLPKTYLVVRSAEEEPVSYRPFTEELMWASWQAYREILLPSLTVEQIFKIDNATHQVFLGLNQLSDYVRNLDRDLIKLSEVEKFGHVVVSLKANLAKLKELMADKPRLVEIALRLFEKNIAAKTPDEAAKLVTLFGPKILAKVGRCHRLYEATRDLTDSTCGVVSVLNGVWFITGWIVFIGTLIVTFGLLLLLHKPLAGRARKSYIPIIRTLPTEARKQKRKTTSPTTSDFSIQAEMDPYPPDSRHQPESLLTEQTGNTDEELPINIS